MESMKEKMASIEDECKKDKEKAIEEIKEFYEK